MVQATMQVWSSFGGSNGSPGTDAVLPTGPPNLRFKAADNNTIDTNNPLTIPGAGNYHSRWKHIYLKCTAINDATTIDNVKFYTATPSWGTGITVYAGNQTPVKNSGASTGYEVADTDDEDMVTGHSGISAQTDVASLTSGSPLTVSISESGSAIDATDEMTNYVVLQMDVASTAAPGDKSNETLTFQYDEV